MAEIVLEEKFMLVARGIETTEVQNVGEAHLRIGQHWMQFRSARGEQFTLYRDKPEDLPSIELGAVHWVRVARVAEGARRG